MQVYGSFINAAISATQQLKRKMIEILRITWRRMETGAWRQHYSMNNHLFWESDTICRH